VLEAEEEADAGSGKGSKGRAALGGLRRSRSSMRSMRAMSGAEEGPAKALDVAACRAKVVDEAAGAAVATVTRWSW
jgi:hypothetical protein